MDGYGCWISTEEDRGNIRSSGTSGTARERAGEAEDRFIAGVMERYHAMVEAEEGTLSAADCNILLMDAIRAELDSMFGSEAPTADD